MSIDMGWFVALAFFTVTYIVLDFFAMIRYEKQIKLLEERVKAWGDCAYVCGYHDGKYNNPLKPITQDEVIAEVEEKKSADQTF